MWKFFFHTSSFLWVGAEMIDLVQLAKQVMIEKGLLPEFSLEVYQELEKMKKPLVPSQKVEDLSSLIWCSIDNDDSRDLDQLTFARKEKNGNFTIWVAIADVDSLVLKNSFTDQHAKVNTTSVYTPAKIFTMLPEKLSYNLTSLNEGESRLAIVVKMEMNAKGDILDSSLSESKVYNWAKLTYKEVGEWLSGKMAIPDKVSRVGGLEEALKVQHTAAQVLRQKRHTFGALTLQSSKVEARVREKDQIVLELQTQNFAQALIEEFMILANAVMAEHLRQANIPSFRRVVRVPRNWPRIVEVARSFGEDLPQKPEAKALDQFLIKRKKADPETFQDLSLTIIKLLGRGEYVIEHPQDKPIGHFGLAIPEYMHSTAPNRRYPDLISQRQYKAYLKREPNPYSRDELEMLAKHCTAQEDAAAKVERRMNKSAAALLLKDSIGSIYNGVVTGVTDKGIWVRIFEPPVEGKIIKGFKNLEVGDRARVKLVSLDILKGFIDFVVV